MLRRILLLHREKQITETHNSIITQLHHANSKSSWINSMNNSSCRLQYCHRYTLRFVIVIRNINYSPTESRCSQWLVAFRWGNEHNSLLLPIVALYCYSNNWTIVHILYIMYCLVFYIFLKMKYCVQKL